MDERKQQAALLVGTIHKLCTELGFVIEPYQLESGVVVISVYDVRFDNRFFIGNEEEVQ